MLGIRSAVSAQRLDEASVLSKTSRGISGATDLHQLRELLAHAASGLHAGARFELYVTGREGDLAPVRAERRDAEGARLLLASIRTHLVALRQPLTEPQLLCAHEMPGRRAVMTAPLLDSPGKLVGLAVIEAPPDRLAFSRAELVTIEVVAAMASLALQRIGVHLPERARARAELDRKAALRVQRAFMSSTLPPGIGVTARAEYLPAFDVGGDFYNVRHFADGTVSATIGDVSGNGVSAALLMSRVASEIDRAIEMGGNPACVLAIVNERLARSDGESYVTAACARISPDRRILTVANAGHLPIVVRRSDGEVFTFGGASGMPLGMLPCDYAEDELCLERGDVVLLFTDGLLEALDHPTGHRGLELLVDEVAAAPHDAREIDDRIRARVDDARREHVLDDITWVGLQVEG